MKLYFRISIIFCIIFCGMHGIGPSSKVMAAEDRPSILLISLTDRLDVSAWYRGIDEYSKLSAVALEVDLEHLALGLSREEIIPFLDKKLSTFPKPDYLIFANQLNLGTEILKLGEKHNVKSFLYIEPLSADDYSNLSGPRGTYKNWIGQLIPDDEKAGYDLANKIINDAKKRKIKKGDTSKVRLIAMSGRRSTPAAYLRHKGLMRAVNTREDVEFLQSVSARWAKDVAARKFIGLQGRYGKIDAVWNANDTMAMGVISVTESNGSLPSIGGVDWIDDAVKALSDEKLVATMGGHVFDIAYVVALINNYHQGIDFADYTGTASLRSNLMILTPDNLSDFEAFLKYKDTEKVDFKKGFKGLVNKDNLKDITIQKFVEQAMNNPERG